MCYKSASAIQVKEFEIKVDARQLKYLFKIIQPKKDKMSYIDTNINPGNVYEYFGGK